MGLRVNFTDVDTGFKPIANGWYPAKVTGGELRESGPNSKNPGSPYINWEFTINGGDADGRKQWLNTSLLPQALFGLKGLLEATGKFTEEELDGDLDFEVEDIFGSDVEILVASRMYDGEMRNEVKRVRAPGSGDTVDGVAGGSMLP